MVQKTAKKTVFILDGSSFLYRAYYAMKPLHTSSGMTVQAVYGFCRMLKKLIDTFDINHIVIIWDSKGATHRHEIFAEYKATRQAVPSDLFEQKALIVELANMIGIAQLSVAGQEADDLMYAFAKKVNHDGYEAVIVSSDKDMRQALCGGIKIYDPFFDKMIDVDSCQQRYGFAVHKIPFYFALVGDSSDNIPGVKGVGEKTASELVKQFESLDDLYQNIAQVDKERTQKLLLASKENAYLSYKLFLLHTPDVQLTLEQTAFNEQNWSRALPLLEKLEFKSLIRDLKLQRSDVILQSNFIGSEKKSLHEKYNFSTITTTQQLEQLCEALVSAEVFALDTETNSLDPMQAKLVGISIAYRAGSAYYIPLAHQSGPQLSVEEVRKYLQPILKNAAIKKYMHNAKYDQLVLLQNGFEVSGTIFDTMIAASLVTREWEKIGLKDLSETILHEPMLSYQDVVAATGAATFDLVPVDIATRYAAADAHQTLKLAAIFEKEIEQQGMHELLYTIELPVNTVLVAMQQEGVFCQVSQLHELSSQVEKVLQYLQDQIYVAAGEQINLNSPKQIRKLLFETLQLTPQKKNSKSEQYSTDAEVLEILAHEHEIPKKLLLYRELFKLKSTYIDALPSYVNGRTHRIHTSWNQTVVATGRLSSSNPNLQNIPKDVVVAENGLEIDVRGAFTAKPGWCFISADYSQIELRILAHLSGDQNLRQAFLSGRDIHKQTAAQMFGVALDDVTTQQRDVGKRLNFSILYGLTAYGLSRDLHISYGDAKKYIELYFQQYPGVLDWMNRVVQQVKEVGYTTTWYGRRRYVPGIYEKNKTLFDFARRVAINTPAQGTAAEITKLGMIKFYDAIARKGLMGKILLQIHDELVVTCPQDEIEETQKLLQQCLTSVTAWDIPLEVSIRVGTNWRDVTK